jgi:hypothetical protein
VGRSQSFFDLVTYGGAYSYHNVRVSGDTGASGQNLWAYTAQFGNGFSGTVSVEDPATRKLGTVDVALTNFFGANALVAPDNAFTLNNNGATLLGSGTILPFTTPAAFGFRVPDLIANLRVDQAWGFAGVSVALHDVSGAYYSATPATVVGANPAVVTTNNVANGHPDDKYGWAVAAGAKFNLPGGDAWGVNGCYTVGAPGFCTNNNAFQVYNSSSSVALGWVADGVFGTGSQVELTQAWSALAFYEHIWNPKWRTAFGGGYVSVDYNANATTLILERMGGAAAACGVAAVGPQPTLTAVTLLPGNGCSPDVSFWEAYMRTQWNPVAQLDIGLEVLYSRRNTAFKGPAIVAATGSRPAVPVLDDRDVWSTMVRWQRNFYP